MQLEKVQVKDIKVKHKVKPAVVYSRLEENFNIITHFVGFLLALVGSIFLISKSVSFELGAGGIFSVLVYSIALLCCFGMSTLYHMMPNHTIRRKVFRRLDHCSIALLIAGTYTPFMLIGVGGVLGIVLATINLTLAVFLVILNSIDVHKFRIISIILYLAMGWLILPVIVPTIQRLGLAAFIWLMMGGISYTVGVIFYKSKSIPLNHAIWHIFVLVGAVLMYVSMMVYVI